MEKFILNDNEYPLVLPLAINSALESNGFANSAGIAVAINNEVIPQDQWKEYLIQPGDRMLVITATQGG